MSKSKHSKRTKAVPVHMTQARFEKIAAGLGMEEAKADALWAACPYSAKERANVSEATAKEVISNQLDAEDSGYGLNLDADGGDDATLDELLGIA